MFRFCLQLICLPAILIASDDMNLDGRWDWIKSYNGGFAGGYTTPHDLGYSIHMIIRNDSVYTFHNDTLKKSDSLSSLKFAAGGTEFVLRTDTLIIQETLIEAVPASYWKKAVATTPRKPAFSFLCTRANYAWGFVHGGWLIDSTGAIRNYQFTSIDSVGYVNQQDTLSSRISDKIFAHSVLTGKKVSIDTLMSMQSLIEPASEGEVSWGYGCNDYGIYRYSAFIGGTGNLPKEIVCYQIGDAWACNSAAAAKKIARWLNSIDTADLQSCSPSASCLNSPVSVPGKGSSKLENPARIAMDGKTVAIHLAQSGPVVIRAYTLRGEMLAQPFEQFLSAGEHRIALTHILSGVQGKKPMAFEISTNNGIGLEMKRVIVSQDR